MHVKPVGVRQKIKDRKSSELKSTSLDKLHAYLKKYIT